VVERVNKLITVRPPKARFAGSAGDVVVGRITEVCLVFLYVYKSLSYDKGKPLFANHV